MILRGLFVLKIELKLFMQEIKWISFSFLGFL